MKRATCILMLILAFCTLKVSGQITGATISGTPNVNSVLTGGFTGSLENSNTIEYKWYYSTTELGSNDTYTVQASDQGHDIYVVASEMSDTLVRQQTSSTVKINSKPVATYPSVVGEIKAGMTVWASYVFSDADSDPESGSTIQWYHDSNDNWSGAGAISGATSKSYKINASYSGDFIGFKITPGSSTGSTPGAEIQSALIEVSANSAPVASGVSVTCSQIHIGRPSVNSVLTGHYTYSDYEGDLESGSIYEWLRASTKTGTYSAISGETGISHQVKDTEQGKFFIFRVKPQAASGVTTGSWVKSDTIGPVNSKPTATVSISNAPTVGVTLHGSYTYSDVDGDAEETSLRVRQWYRNGVPISGETSADYELTVYDVDKTISFKVTPASVNTVFPYMGDTYSASVGPVDDPVATPPAALDACITGTRGIGKTLIGQYTYSNGYTEQSSYYMWFREGVTTPVKAGYGDSNKSYTQVSADEGKEIIFGVIPRNNRSQIGDTAFTVPLTRFDLLRDVFSLNDDPQLLIANPSGGSFEGDGVTNGYYDPEVAGVGKDTLKYVLTYTASQTCVQTAYQIVEVRPITVQFYGIDDVYCDGKGADTVYVLNVPKTASMNQFYITDPNSNLQMITDTSAIFYPDLMKTGDKKDVIYYSYKEMLGIPFELPHPLVIDHIGTVSILNLNPGDAFCFNGAPVFLSASPSGGSFSGPVQNNKLVPSLIEDLTSQKYGDISVNYTYKSPIGCTKSVSVPIRINPLPVINFNVQDFCIDNDSDSTVMVNSTAWIDPVKTWTWEFFESGITTRSHRKEPSFMYLTGGTHEIILNATTINECTDTLKKSFNLGRKPKAGFTWVNECYSDTASLYFTDASLSPSFITSRRWIFNNEDTVFNKTKTSYPHPAPGFMPVSYQVKTGYPNCDDIITKDVYIRESVVIPADGYLEDFESGQGGWVKDYESRNSWVFGTPNRTIIDRAASGSNAWYTGYDILNQKPESSSFISPCFDFTSIKRPMISLKIWKRFDRYRDGAALQYKIGDSGNWEYAGAPDDGGIGWFNSTLIKGRPGGELTGWTTLNAQDTTWSESRHKIDELAGKSNVKFRIAYGSSGDSQDNEGVAFDDIRIGERTRNVLLEHFTNMSSEESSLATTKVNDVISTINKDIINIQYHTNFPGSDAYFNENPGDVSARILFYGLIRSPYLFVDGGNTPKSFAKNYDYAQTELDSNDVISRSLVNPAFNIDLNTLVKDGILTVTGQVRALENRVFENLTLYLAVTERENTEHTGALGETTFKNVFRKFIPDAGGINLNRTWNRGDNVNFDKSWIIRNIKNSADIEVIAFLQNNITKEIYQANSRITYDIMSGIKETVFEGIDFDLYPNPAVTKLTLSFREPLKNNSEIRIYDIMGIVVAEWKADAGLTEFTVDDTGLKKGMYLVRVSSKGIDLGFRKLIISGN